MAKSETRIQNEIRGTVNSSGLAVLFRNNVGKLPNPHGPGYIAYGLAKGSSDLIGMFIGTGKFLAIEVKSLKGVEAEHQRAWGKFVIECGGIYAVCRSAEEAMEVVRAAV